VHVVTDYVLVVPVDWGLGGCLCDEGCGPDIVSAGTGFLPCCLGDAISWLRGFPLGRA